MKKTLLAVALSLAMASAHSVEMTTERVEIDYKVKGVFSDSTHKIKLTIWRDERKPTNTPFIILNHGRSDTNLVNFDVASQFGSLAKYLVSYGFTVIAPTRPGYGRDRENVNIEDMFGSGNSCLNGRVTDVLADQGAAILEHVRSLPYINPSNGVVAGTSYGGMMAISMAGHQLPGIKAVFSIAGGMGGNPGHEPHCKHETTELMNKYGKASPQIPELWVYAKDEDRLPPNVVAEWSKAFKDGGGNVQVVMLPDGGHAIGIEKKISEVAQLFKKFAQDNGIIH